VGIQAVVVIMFYQAVSEGARGFVYFSF